MDGIVIDTTKTSPPRDGLQTHRKDLFKPLADFGSGRKSTADQSRKHKKDDKMKKIRQMDSPKTSKQPGQQGFVEQEVSELEKQQTLDEEEKRKQDGVEQVLEGLLGL